jgi:predicted nucleic acid-binding protein
VDVEFSNVLWKRVAFSGTSRSKAEEIWKAFRDLPIDRTPDESLLDDARAFAYKYRCTVYDSLYAVLASRGDSDLITADAKLAKVAEAAGIKIIAL